MMDVPALIAIMLPGCFPLAPEDYAFSTTPVAQYLAMLDRLLQGRGFEPPSAYLNDFLLCTLIWIVARRERSTELLTWLDNLYQMMLHEYLAMP